MFKKFVFLVFSLFLIHLSIPSFSSAANVASTTEGQTQLVLNENTLKRSSHTLCSLGFTAYVGTNKKNVCRSKVTPPNIAYSCVWEKKGNAAYSSSAQNPCTLDYTQHRGSIIITQEQFSSNPPLSYGVEAQCCARAEVGAPTTRYY